MPVDNDSPRGTIGVAVDTAQSPKRRWSKEWRAPASLTARGLGALSLLAMGSVHLQQYLWLYSAIPTIGKLFVLNFAAATVIGLALLSPIGRWAGRWRRAVSLLLTLSGVALAAGSFALLLVSEHTPLFGFREPGYDPAAIAASRGAEIAAVVFLGTSLALPLLSASHVRRRWPLPAADHEGPRTTRLDHSTKETTA